MLVYKATSPNGKSYIGITTKSLQNRINRHHTCSRKGSNLYIHNVIRKYGQKNIKWQIIHDDIKCRKKLRQLQKFYILKYDTYMVINKEDKSLISGGYNMTLGGESWDNSYGYKHTQRSKKIMSQKKLGIKLKKQHIQKIRLKNIGQKRSLQFKIKQKQRSIGRKHSQQSRKKISLAKQNLSQQARRNISLAQMGQKNHNYGKTFTQQHCKKISLGVARHERTAQHNANISKARKGCVSNRKGIKLSEQTIQKMKKSRPQMNEQYKQKIKNGFTLQMRQKISEQRKRYWRKIKQQKKNSD